MKQTHAAGDGERRSKPARRSRRAAPSPRRALKSRYGYLWATLALFILSVIGHWLFGWKVFVADAEAHGEPIKTGQYVVEMARDTLENWQSEFLQLIWQVAGLALLWYIGSPQSKEGDDRLEAKIDFLLGQVEGGEALQRELDQRYPRK